MSSKKLKKRQRAFENLKLNTNSKYNRVFSEAFRKDKVKQIQENQLTVREVSDLYDVTKAAVYKWIYKYSHLEKGTKQVIQMESEAFKTKRLQEKVAELERIIGQKQLEIDLLSKTLELSSEDLGYDLKKKYATKSSSFIDKTQ